MTASRQINTSDQLYPCTEGPSTDASTVQPGNPHATASLRLHCAVQQKLSLMNACSKTTAKMAGRASVPPKTVANEVPKLVDKSLTRTAAARKTVSKAIAKLVGSPHKPSPQTRPKTATKAVELASIPAKTVADEAENLAGMGATATAAGAALAKEAGLTERLAETSSQPARSTTAAKVVELAAIPPKAAVNIVIALAAEASRERIAADEIIRNATAQEIDTFKDAATETLYGAEGIADVGSELVNGVIEIQETVWNSVQRMFQAAVEVPAQFAACTSFADLAQTHRAVVRPGFTEWLNVSREILKANRRITDRAIHAWELC